MKKMILPLLILSAIISTETKAQIIHVSPKGDDRAEGTEARPLKTLPAARDRMRTLRAKSNRAEYARIIMHGGVYDLSEPLVLNEQDGGTAEHPLVWTGVPGENVSITGGRTLRSEKFKKVSDAGILAQFDPAARGQIMQIDLKAEGVKDFGRHRQYGHSLPVIASTLELFFQGEPMTLARYPNNGAIKIGKVSDPGSVPRIGDKSNRGATFAYTDARHKRWAGVPNIWIQGTLNYGFADDYNPIASIDTLKGTVKLGKPHLYGVASGRDFQEYVAINILSELDSPGEWYVDDKKGILYLWPPSDVRKAVVQVSILETPIIALEGVSHLRFERSTIEVGRGIGVYMERCHRVVVAGCTIRNTGTAGVFMGQGARLIDSTSSVDDYIGEPVSREVGSYQNHIYNNTTWQRNAGSYNGVESCDIYNTGCGGITLSGGDKKTLTPGHSYAVNNRISRYNRRNKFTWAGIRVDGCGNRIAHNEIFESDWHGIFVHGNEHVFEYNHVHDVTLNSNDTSPWYIGRNPSDRGNVVRYNFFDHCGNPNRMNMGIYCDDSSSDVYIYGNVFNDMHTDHGVLFSNTGWHLVMRNNIVINPSAHTAITSANYYTWAAPQAASMFGKDGLIRKRLENDVNFRNPPYSTRYPGLLPYLDEAVAGKEWESMRARGNLLERNLIIGGPENPVKLLGGQHAQMDSRNNWVTKEDPGFVDMKGKDFRLKPDAKAYAMIPGFEPVPFDKMGIYKDSYRK